MTVTIFFSTATVAVRHSQCLRSLAGGLAGALGWAVQAVAVLLPHGSLNVSSDSEDAPAERSEPP